MGAGFKAIGIALQKQELKTITHLDLSWNTMDEDAVITIARVLGSMKELALKKARKAIAEREAAFIAVSLVLGGRKMGLLL